MTVPVPSFRVRSAISVLCLSALLPIAGCGKSSAKVSGKVTLDGQPLKGGGTLTFEGSQGGASGTINPDGAYTISNAPLGEVKITLESGWDTPPPTAMSKRDPSKAQPGKPIPRRGPLRPPESLKNIPAKYNKAETSGLTYTVKPGDQNFDIPLTK